MPHLHLYNRAGFRDNAAKSGKAGHNRDIGPNFGTVPAKSGHLATMQKAPKEETLSEIEPVISSIAQGPAKNTIKID